MADFDYDAVICGGGEQGAYVGYVSDKIRRHECRDIRETTRIHQDSVNIPEIGYYRFQYY